MQIDSTLPRCSLYCLSLEVFRSDIAFHIRGSVYMCAMMTKNKSHDPLYSKSMLGSRISQKHTNRTILRSDREYRKSIRIKQVRDLVDSADAVEKPSDKKIQGVTAMSKSVSFTPLKKRDLNKLGVPKQARKRRRFKRLLTSLLEAPLQGTEP